jgi:hypothetical protein
MPLKVLLRDGSVERPEIPDDDPVTAFVAELDEARRIVEDNGPVDSVLDARLARDAIAICEAVAQSIRNNETVVLKESARREPGLVAG